MPGGVDSSSLMGSSNSLDGGSAFGAGSSSGLGGFGNNSGEVR